MKKKKRTAAILAPILCDYCNAPAARVITSGPRECRLIVCEEHAERGRNAQEPIRYWPYVRIVDPPLPGRDRYLGLHIDALIAMMRERLPTAD